jgi:hypothetical protein
LIVAALAGGLALVLGLAGFALQPDAALYVSSGVSLYPSPIGSSLGAVLGEEGFAALHACAVGAVAFELVRARPSFAALGVSLPVLWWVLPVGVHAVSTLGLLVAVRLWTSRGELAELGFAALAFLHLAALPWLVCFARWWVAALVGGLLVVVMLGTPYGAAFPGEEGFRALPVALAVAGAVVLIGLAPVLLSPADDTSSGTLALAAVAVFMAALYGVQADLVHRDASVSLAFFAATRYALPLTVLALVLGARRRTERPTTAPGKGAPVKRLRAFGLSLVVTSVAALLLASVASAQTVPAVPVDTYGDALLSSLATAIGTIFPYAAAITAFAIGVGMVKRWLGHRKATRV